MPFASLDQLPTCISKSQSNATLETSRRRGRFQEMINVEQELYTSTQHCHRLDFKSVALSWTSYHDAIVADSVNRGAAERNRQSGKHSSCATEATSHGAKTAEIPQVQFMDKVVDMPVVVATTGAVCPDSSRHPWRCSTLTN